MKSTDGHPKHKCAVQESHLAAKSLIESAEAAGHHPQRCAIDSHEVWVGDYERHLPISPPSALPQKLLHVCDAAWLWFARIAEAEGLCAMCQHEVRLVRILGHLS